MRDVTLRKGLRRFRGELDAFGQHLNVVVSPLCCRAKSAYREICCNIELSSVEVAAIHFKLL